MIRQSIKNKGQANEKNFIARRNGYDAGRSILGSRSEGSGRSGRRRRIQFFAGAVVWK